MIIDKILDRKEGWGYSAKEFYEYCNSQEVGWPIARAMDEGTNFEVCCEILQYLVNNRYVPELVKYNTPETEELIDFVMDSDWLNDEPMSEAKRLQQEKFWAQLMAR